MALYKYKKSNSDLNTAVIAIKKTYITQSVYTEGNSNLTVITNELT